MSTRGRLKRGDAASLEKQPDHPFGYVEVGYRTLSQGPHRDDVAGRASDHLPGLVPDGEHVLAPRI